MKMNDDDDDVDDDLLYELVVAYSVCIAGYEGAATAEEVEFERAKHFFLDIFIVRKS